MAETKETKAQETKETKETQETKETKVPEGEELISIRLPITKENKEDVFVRVNHRTWLIKRGETVQLPKCAVEVLEHAEQAMLEGMAYQAAHEKGE